MTPNIISECADWILNKCIRFTGGNQKERVYHKTKYRYFKTLFQELHFKRVVTLLVATSNIVAIVACSYNGFLRVTA